MSGSREARAGWKEDLGAPAPPEAASASPELRPSLCFSLLLPPQFPHPLNETRTHRLAKFRAGGTERGTGNLVTCVPAVHPTPDTWRPPYPTPGESARPKR